MSDGLFVYGTLRFPEVLEVLLGRVPHMQGVSVTGWRVKALPDVTYPGMVAEPGVVAEGVLISGLSAEEQQVLDEFEDQAYEPRAVTLDGGGRARAYVWTGPTEPHDWDPVRFAEEDLTGFVEDCRRL